MNRNRGFDEVMIVNPGEPGQGARLMRFHYGEPPEMGYVGEDTYGYYAEPPVEGYGYFAEDPYGYYAESPFEGYGYFAEDPYGYYAESPFEGYGYFAEPPDMGFYAAPQGGYGYFAEDPYGYYAEAPPESEAAYARNVPVAGYGQYEPVGYFAEEPPYGQYEPVGWYGQVPEMVGYGEMEPLAEDYPGMADYAEPEIAGYVRDVPPRFNAGCPMPTNVAGFGEPPLDGYVRPTAVSPTCTDFTPQPGPSSAVPDTLKPLW
jgi:hypothetical protein